MVDPISLWTQALRSGEFQQTTGALACNGRFCCLGVGCEVYRRATGRGNWTPGSGGNYRFGPDKYGFASEATLPREVQEWFGLFSNEGHFGVHQSHSLASENDEGLRSFEYIADLIESRPPGLFVEV